MYRMYHAKPDIRQWRNEIAQLYDVRDILFFGDFSNQSLRGEIPRIREVSSSIIETQNASAYHKKDYTDFIMLDHIYQRAITYGADTDVYIIFSGDGHFSSVASFLVNRCSKTVAVYGIRDALSMQLRNTATIAIEWPPADFVPDEQLRIGTSAGRTRSAVKADPDTVAKKQESSGKAQSGTSAKKQSKNQPVKQAGSAAEQTDAVQAGKNPGKKQEQPAKNNASAQATQAKSENAGKGQSKSSEKQGKASQNKLQSEKQTVPASEQAKTEQKQGKRADKNQSKRAQNAQNRGTDQNGSAVSDKQNAAQAQGKAAENAADSAASGSQGGSKSRKANSGRSGNGGSQNQSGADSTAKETPQGGSASGKGSGERKANARRSDTKSASRSNKPAANATPEAEPEDIFTQYYRSILKNIAFYERSNMGKTQLSQTYGGTVDSVSEYYGLDRDIVTVALDKLCESGYITLSRSGLTKNSKLLNVDWDKAKKDGLSD